MLHRWLMPACLLAAVLCACTATPVPSGVDTGRIAFSALPAVPAISIDGPGDKAGGARRGAAAGGGGGLLLGGMLCAAAGPLAVLCAGPALAITAIGAAGGAAIGAMTAASANEVEARRALLETSLAGCACAERLAVIVRDAVGDGRGAPADWTAQLRIVEVGTVGSGAGQPFALRLVARMSLGRAGGAEPALVKDYVAAAAPARLLDDWRRDDSAALRSALESGVQSVAAQILADLRSAR